MSSVSTSAVLRQIRTLFGAGAAGGMGDGELLERFRSAGGGPDAEAAFAVLVARHGPMVLGVCHRALRDPNDAADAFQATFLVLVRKAGSVRVDDSLGRWLYGVSRRVAAKARAVQVRDAARAAGELGQEPVALDESSAAAAERRELLAALDEEVSRLPEPFRSVVTLCDLGGWTQEAAACELGCPVGTVESRLHRARKRLRERLARRGLAPAPTAALAGPAGLARPPAVPEALSASTVAAAARAAAVPAGVTALIEGVIADMAWKTLTTSALAVCAVTVACGLGIVAARQLRAEAFPPWLGTTFFAAAEGEDLRGAPASRQLPPQAAAPDGRTWVGQQVITRLGARLKAGPPGAGGPGAEVALRNEERETTLIYQVAEANGPWLCLEQKSHGLRGWVQATQVVLFDQAIDYFTDVIRADPKSAAAYRRRGALRLGTQKYDQAIADFDEAIRLDPRYAWAFYERAKYWAATGAPDKAMTDLNEAIRLDPAGNSWAYTERGTFYDDQGELERAFADYSRALELDPKEYDALCNRAGTWGKRAEYDKAIADYDRAIGIQPEMGPAYRGRAWAWRAKGDDARALADFDRAIALDPRDSRVYDNRGWYWSDRGEHDKAIADYNEAIRLDPRNPAAHLGRGEAWDAKGDVDKALADYGEAVRLDPGHSRSYEHRAGLLLRMGRHDEAIADYTEAIRLQPDNALAYRGRASIWFRKGEFDKAIADDTEAIRLEPAEASVYVTRGQAWYGKGENDRAIADYTEAIRLDPGDAYRHYARGLAWDHKEEYDKAIADYTEALRLAPEDAFLYYYTRALSWRAKGDQDKAADDFAAAVRIVPKDADGYISRSIAWSATGEYGKALADLNEAMRLDPEDANACRMAAWLWATCPDAQFRDGKRAVEAATRARELSGGADADMLDTLAAACAEAGDFDAAVKHQEEAVGMHKDEAARSAAGERLALYRARKPYRQDPAAR
jgi:RNA polymerase sigma factor (sigma-70 family)